jgi:deoxyribonuclease V
MDIPDLHPWDVSPGEAARIQRELRARVSLTDSRPLAEIRTVAGADNGYLRRAAQTTAYAAVLLFSFPALELLETQVASCPVEFPYVPGLLSFREAPALLAAFRQLTIEPDLILFDAHGYAHPRRLGAASHLGLVLDRPSIGCAKSRLIGRYDEPGDAFGSRSPLVDRGEVVGAVVRTRPGHGPLFVSCGHKIALDSAVAVTLACCREQRFMPEPTRLADRLVKQVTRAARG